MNPPNIEHVRRALDTHAPQVDYDWEAIQRHLQEQQRWRRPLEWFVLPLLWIVIAGLLLLVFVLLLVQVILTLLLSRSWRFDWKKGLALDPTVHATCPRCDSALILGTVEQRFLEGTQVLGREWTMPTQTSRCAQCQREFTRTSLGKVWSSWQE
jgi:hypothetical protein